MEFGLCCFKKMAHQEIERVNPERKMAESRMNNGLQG
jgi:hypothetical protein